MPRQSPESEDFYTLRDRIERVPKEDAAPQGEVVESAAPGAAPIPGRPAPPLNLPQAIVSSAGPEAAVRLPPAIGQEAMPPVQTQKISAAEVNLPPAIGPLAVQPLPGPQTAAEINLPPAIGPLSLPAAAPSPTREQVVESAAPNAKEIQGRKAPPLSLPPAIGPSAKVPLPGSQRESSVGPGPVQDDGGLDNLMVTEAAERPRDPRRFRQVKDPFTGRQRMMNEAGSEALQTSYDEAIGKNDRLGNVDSFNRGRGSEGEGGPVVEIARQAIELLKTMERTLSDMNDTMKAIANKSNSGSTWS